MQSKRSGANSPDSISVSALRTPSSTTPNTPLSDAGPQTPANARHPFGLASLFLDIDAMRALIDDYENLLREISASGSLPATAAHKFDDSQTEADPPRIIHDPRE